MNEAPPAAAPGVPGVADCVSESSDSAAAGSGRHAADMARRTSDACGDGVSAFRAIISQNPVFLAPMAGWTDVVYRCICKQMGAGLTYTEMVSAQGLEHGSAKTWEYLEVSEEEGRVAVQLFGSDPEVMARQAQAVCERMEGRLAAIDVNMGCPARKVVRKGEGSALMETPELAARIVERMVSESDVPVTVKFRRGFRAGHETAVDFARAMEQAGASAMCVHGRYASDFYRGTADWDVVRKVAGVVQVPVIASGDLLSAQSIDACLRYTGCDAVMVARGAQGNPWIFGQARELMDRRAAGDSVWEPAPVPLDERIRVARLHVRMLDERDPHKVVQMRTYFNQYFKGIPGAAAMRARASSCSTLQDFEALFDQMTEVAEAHGRMSESGRDAGSDDRPGQDVASDVGAGRRVGDGSDAGVGRRSDGGCGTGDALAGTRPAGKDACAAAEGIRLPRGES